MPKRSIRFFIKFSRRKLPRKNRQAYLENKNQALVLVKNRLEYFGQYFSFKFNRISIRDQKTRWGSCSKKGNLNFNYKIVFLPPSLSDYIIVHEFCHLKEFNHSSKFWDLVAEIVPDYLRLRQELKSR